MVDDGGSQVAERLGLGPGAVVDGEVDPGIEQAFADGEAHSTDADPTNSVGADIRGCIRHD